MSTSAATPPSGPALPPALPPSPPPSPQLGPEWIGKRLTLRLHDPEGGFRDAVGILESETSIRKRDGSLLHFSPKEIAIWRAIAPIALKAGRGAPLSLRVQEIELAANATWPAQEEIHLGDWILRASGKFTKRANSVLAIGSPGINLDAAIEKVVEFYTSRNMTPTIHVAMPTYTELGNTLQSKGWVSDISVNVMVADINEVLEIVDDLQTESQSEKKWEIVDSPSDEWLALQNDQGVSEIMTRCAARYAGVRMHKELICIGRASNFEKWTVLTRLYVRPDNRGRGLGRDLILSLLRDAQQKGATKSMLQVDSKNLSAIGLYKKLGFRLHHTYEYFTYKPGTDVSKEC